MTTVQVTPEIEIDLDQLLGGMAQLETPDLEHLLDQVSLLLAQRKAPNLPQREAELFHQINQGLPDGIQQRYDDLWAKLHTETITPVEHQELLALIDRVEMADAERLQYLMILAQLRQVSLNELMAQLGIQPPPVHG